jgi:hypothetical protein
MTGYQLSCGCWVTELYAYRIGDVVACVRCDTMRTIVTGYATGPGEESS